MIRKGCLLLAACLALAGTCWGQRASNWRVYRAADGLPESVCSSVTYSPRGKVWVRFLNTESVSELDGYTVQNLPTPGARHGRVYESPGGQIWAAAEDGLQEFEDAGWIRFPVPEIAAQFQASALATLHPITLVPVKQGFVIFLLPEGLFQFNSANRDVPQVASLRAANQTKLERFSGMSAARNGGLWISGARGLARVPGPSRAIKPETEWQEFVPPEALQLRNFQEPQEDSEGGVTAVAEAAASGQKVVARFDGEKWLVLPAGNSKLRMAWSDHDQKHWAATIDALYQYDQGRSRWSENEEISARQYFDLAIEPGGAFWLATSDGLFRCAPCLWQAPDSAPRINSPIHCLTEDHEARVWFASATSLYGLQDQKLNEYPFPTQWSERLQGIRTVFPLGTNTLILDVGNGLIKFHARHGELESLTMGTTTQLKCLGWFKNGTICMQAIVTDNSGETYQLESYDGDAFRPFAGPQPPAALGTDLLSMLATQNGSLLLSSSRGVAWLRDGKWQLFNATDGTVPLGAAYFIELLDGKIWCATQDKVWEFSAGNWRVVRAGFDGITALLQSHDGSMWVASNGGLHRFVQNAWVENGVDDGLPGAAIRQIMEDHTGRIWAGTTHGLSLYHPEADQDPPLTTVQIVTDREKNNIPEGTTVMLAFGAQDKWKYTPPDHMLYSYRLDEMDWSPFLEPNNVSFSELPAGKHYFQVRAMDRNCNVDLNKPARLEFAVALPWYKEARLRWITIIGVAVVVFFAGLAFNRHLQLLRSHAEVDRKVAERTRQLEMANRELFHSQKMNALGTLAAGIAHDFNNILSIIKGSAQIIEDNLDNPQKVHTRVDRIKTVVEQGAGIVKAMLGFSRSSEGQSALCDVNEVVNETVKLLGDRFLREVEVRCEPATEIPLVPGSQDFIQQILLNFIFNAADAMTGQREITLATGKLNKLPAGMALLPAEAASYVFISVKDFGSGISAENMPRIFEPFFTTKAMSVRRGTGLGLSMVYELAKKMEAGLAVKSAVNQGSTFTLILPVRELPANPVEAGGPTATKRPQEESAIGG